MRCFRTKKNIYLANDCWTIIPPRISDINDDEVVVIPKGTTMTMLERKDAVFLTHTDKISGLYIEFDNINQIMTSEIFTEVAGCK